MGRKGQGRSDLWYLNLGRGRCYSASHRGKLPTPQGRIWL